MARSTIRRHGFARNVRRRLKAAMAPAMLAAAMLLTAVGRSWVTSSSGLTAANHARGGLSGALAGQHTAKLSLLRSAPPSRVCRRAVAFDKDPWQILGVEKAASQVDIKRAYRRQALKSHPDVNKEPNAKERWQDLSAAYDILSDPEKTRLWEASRMGGGSAGSSRRSPPRGTWQGGPTPKGQRQKDMDEQYDAGGDSFGSIFGDFLEGVGREVGGEGGTVGKARKAGKFVLEELLDFLDGGPGARSNSGDWDGTKPQEELRLARDELETFKKLDESFRTDAQTWASQADTARAANRRQAELDAMQKVFDARERRKSVRRRVLRAEERVEYLEKVVFETNLKQAARSQARSQSAPVDTPGMYTITHDGTKVGPTREMSDKVVGELQKGTSVRVMEVISTPSMKRVRGRVDSPAGWISLMNTETGYRWAEKSGRDAGAGSSSAGGPRSSVQAAFDVDSALQDLKSRKAAE